VTIINVNTPAGRLSLQQRRILAASLTDAVLVPEVGQLAPAARAGFQVLFTERPTGAMAIGGRLIEDNPADVMWIDITVMDADWPKPVRREVIERVLAALTEACDQDEPSPGWWVTFRVVDDGSWGSRGTVLSILDLLDTGVFTPHRADDIRAVFQTHA
jgi:phenylpyruvate tautomerase PptA (4-oxalocrotonate tautomerase family)